MVFVTGGTGVVGSHLLYALCKAGKRVRALSRASSNRKNVEHVFAYYSKQAAALFAQIEWHEGDLLDYYAIEDAMAGADEVYHCAAMVSFEPKKAGYMKHLNQKGTENVVNAALALQVGKLCHVSSIAAVGDTLRGEAIDEQAERADRKRSAYAESKYNAEMEIWRGISEGLNAVIVNPSVILAPGNWGKSSTSLFTTVWNGLKYYTSGSTGYVDVRDVAQLMIRLMEENKMGERYILNADNLGYREIFSSIAQNLGKKAPHKEIGPTLLRIAHFFLSLKTFALGGQPLITSDMLRSAFSKSNYSNKKITSTLNYSFIPVEKSVSDFARFFLKDNSA